MRLKPVEASWATQLNKQCQTKQEREKTRKAKGQGLQNSINDFIWIKSRMQVQNKEVIFISEEVLLQQKR